MNQENKVTEDTPTGGVIIMSSESCTIGVGDGTGSLFVHGSYEAVKRVQEIIFENEHLRTSKAAPDPRTPANMRVNGGALILALNVLRRAGKNEVADELEKTAAPAAQEDALDAAQPAARRWPPVSGIGRDAGHSRAVVVYLTAEPTDDEMRALHDAVRGLGEGCLDQVES